MACGKSRRACSGTFLRRLSKKLAHPLTAIPPGSRPALLRRTSPGTRNSQQRFWSRIRAGVRAGSAAWSTDLLDFSTKSKSGILRLNSGLVRHSPLSWRRRVAPCCPRDRRPSQARWRDVGGHSAAKPGCPPLGGRPRPG